MIKAELPTPYSGLIEAYREIIPTVIRQMKDSTYQVKRLLPAANGKQPPVVAEAIFGHERALLDGWVEVCDHDHMSVEDVVRFDFNQRTYAVYCTAEGKFHATYGICTHGKTHLAAGMVRGNLIECPKHNGRFDVRDGSPQRRRW